MWVVSKYTVPPGLSTHRVLNEWDFGYKQYVTWYWGVWLVIYGGVWVRNQLIWMEEEIIMGAKVLWGRYGFWEWVEALEGIEEKGVVGMVWEYIGEEYSVIWWIQRVLSWEDLLVFGWELCIGLNAWRFFK